MTLYKHSVQHKESKAVEAEGQARRSDLQVETHPKYLDALFDQEIY
jgi:hypothetical protein